MVGSSVAEAVHGTRLCLDTDSESGYLLVRDTVSAHLIESMFAVLAVLGWYPVEDEEGIEPYVFDEESDASSVESVGVKIWLYRMARPMAAILRDVIAKAA